MRKAKMVCTIGPSTNGYNNIVKLLKSGMNVARLNMSHGNLTSHQETLDTIKKARQDLNVPCAIMVDTCGPELRIGTFADHTVTLTKGQLFVFSTTEVVGTVNEVYCGYPALLERLKPKQKLYANNGLLEFTIQRVENGKILCKVDVGGDLSNHKSISIPRIRLPLPFISEKDEKNIEFAAKNDVEFISASFVSTPEDVKLMRECIKKYGGRQEIISKIESAEGIVNLEKIIDVSDGIMVARGDMGTEIPIEQIPAVQKNMIEKTVSKGKRVIVATEMLESMIYKRRPTRAEITDVAQAIYDGTTATMLSGETASGQYPFEAASTMAKTIVATEKVADFDNKAKVSSKIEHKNLDALSCSAVAAAKALNAKAIVCFTDKGKTAKMLSRFYPKATIVAITHDDFVYNDLALAWGVYPVKTKEFADWEEMLSSAEQIVKDLNIAKTGDTIVITLGIPASEKGTTNAIKISQIN
ncbi:MAG: pyruvate kinase [Clostridia bacterium]|nr:pyruvate kinase [Clostridia bacterium]